MSRARRVLLVVALVILAAPIVLVGAMRVLRHRASDAAPVRAGVMRVRNLFTEIYGVRVGEKIIVFDAGIDIDAHAIDRLVSALGGTRDDVSDLFLTHGHFDHVTA